MASSRLIMKPTNVNMLKWVFLKFKHNILFASHINYKMPCYDKSPTTSIKRYNNTKCYLTESLAITTRFKNVGNLLFDSSTFTNSFQSETSPVPRPCEGAFPRSVSSNLKIKKQPRSR